MGDIIVGVEFCDKCNTVLPVEHYRCKVSADTFVTELYNKRDLGGSSFLLCGSCYDALLDWTWPNRKRYGDGLRPTPPEAMDKLKDQVRKIVALVKP